MSKPIRWLKDCEKHDYKAAYAYLTILLDAERAAEAVDRLKTTGITSRRVNDILRSCDREPLPKTDPGVKRALARIRKGEKVSPILVVSFHWSGDIADGYHRASSVYHLDPFADVPCRIAHVPELELA